jgi:hypothetical protein
LGSVKEFFENWKEPELLQQYLTAKAAKEGTPGKAAEEAIAKQDVKHEQIGLILTKRIFAEPTIDDACRTSLNIDSAAVAADVIALMELGMPPTTNLTGALAKLAQNGATNTFVKSEPDEFVRDLVPVLASLISGTLDVDRMDYLLRDSFYCGVSYGRIDIEHIIAGLGLATNTDAATNKQRTYLTIKEKGVLAIDDLLWSRHQMFLQVYGHKTNVALNRMLQLALPEAMEDLPDLNRPRDQAAYLEFTDDFVLSKIVSLCFREKRLGKESYARLLARREVPEHLGALPLPTPTSDPEGPEVMAERDRIAKVRGVAPEKVRFAPSSNEIIKKGPLPSVFVKTHGGWELQPYRTRSSLLPTPDGETVPVPPSYATVHFFMERAVANDRPTRVGQEISPSKIEKLRQKSAAGKTKKK